MKYRVIIEKLEHDEIVDILSTALYGSFYWKVDNTTKEYEEAKGNTIEDKLADILLNDKDVILIDTEEDEAYTLDLAKLYKGIELYIKNGGHIIIEDYDFNDADSILQYALFGEIVFG